MSCESCWDGYGASRPASVAIKFLVNSLKLSSSMEPKDSNEDDARAALTESECQDLIASKVWTVNTEWSREAEKLRQLAALDPSALSSEKVVKRTLRHLRLEDMQITEIDVGVSEYNEMEELILTGNYLRTVEPRCLPKQLKVLELCCNKIECLSALDTSPPALLQHLGASYNLLTEVVMTPSNWSSLLSLDLSYNKLQDLPGIIKILSQIPHLKSLVMMGNPLAMVTCYFSYVIDSLPGLISFDDCEVTVKEKQLVGGIRKHCEKKPELLKSARIELKVDSITGLPQIQCEVNSAKNAEKMTLYLLQLSHTFVAQGVFKPVLPLDSISSADFARLGKMVQDTNISASHENSSGNQHDVYMTPTIYSTTPFEHNQLTAKYKVSDLIALKHFLEGEQTTLNVWLKKVVFAKEDTSPHGGTAESIKVKKNEKGNKSGRNTAQSGRSSAQNKKTEDKKGKTSCAQELPGEGWKVSSVKPFLLATFQVDITSLLKRSVHTLQRELEGTVDLELLKEHQLLRSGASSEQAGKSGLRVKLEFTLEQWNSISDIDHPHAQ